MKQLPMTPELKASIQKAVGEDVDPTNFAVFEAIALNDKPLVGKKGTLFESAVVMPVTLAQMVDNINSGNHLPLVADHELFGTPKGRVFHAALNYEGVSAEMRVLFYMDETEALLISKLNAGSLDEVSVSFMSTQFLCSECGWDYFGFGSSENIYERRCGNGHSIGEDDVHGLMVGLNQFIETSLVARGAADKPKIVGRSQSKLQPASAMRLAANGFELDGLICRASAGEEVVSVDTNKLMNDLVEKSTQVATLSIEKANADGKVTSLTAELTSANEKATTAEAKVTALTTELEAAKAQPANQEDYALALTFLTEVYTKVLTASGEQAPAELPKTVADLKTAISEKTANLTAILPVGGKSDASKDGNTLKAGLVPSAFTNRNLNKGSI